MNKTITLLFVAGPLLCSQAGTTIDPANHYAYLRITAITRQSSPGTYTTLSWPGKPTRFYAAQRRNSLDPSDSWLEFISGGPGASWFGFGVTTNQQFFRLRV